MGWSWVADSLFAGTAERGCVRRGATLVAMLDGSDSDRETEAGELVDWSSSSSFDLRRAEISTLSDGNRSRGEEFGGEECAHGDWYT